MFARLVPIITIAATMVGHVAAQCANRPGTCVTGQQPPADCLRPQQFCPSRDGKCKSQTGATRQAADQNACEGADPAPAGGPWTWEASMVDQIGAQAVQSLAGNELICCGGSAAKRCNGENECDDLTGACRVDGDSIICGSDELNCGGLVDQIISGAFAGISAGARLQDGKIPLTRTTGVLNSVTLGETIELRVGTSLASEWMKPYNKVMRSYSAAMCTTYSELAQYEPSMQFSIIGITYTANLAAADRLQARFPALVLPACAKRAGGDGTAATKITTCNGNGGVNCQGCQAEMNTDTELGCLPHPQTRTNAHKHARACGRCDALYSRFDTAGCCVRTVLVEYTPPENFVGTVEIRDANSGGQARPPWSRDCIGFLPTSY
jgi:hypothetical protein